MPLAALAGKFAGGALNTALDIADGRQIFIHAAAVRCADDSIDLGCLFADKIEHAQVELLAPLLRYRGFARRLAGKQAIENNPRVHFLGSGRRGRAPRDIGLINATIARVAKAVILTIIAAELQRRKPSGIADSLGGELVASDCRTYIVAQRSVNGDAGKISRHRAGVGTASAGFGVRKVGEDDHVGFEAFKGR